MSLPDPGQRIKPIVSDEIAIQLMRNLYGLEVTSLKKLDAYDDINYHVSCDANKCDNAHLKRVSPGGYVLKVINSLDSKNMDLMEGQTLAMIFLNENGVSCPVPVKQKKGAFVSVESFWSGIGVLFRFL